MRCASVIAAAFLGLLPHLEAAPKPVLDCPMEYREGMLWVKVHTPGSDAPLNFLLDTGAGVSVINLETAQRLGLKGGLTVSVSGVSGTTEGRWPLRMKADLHGYRLPRSYLAVDLNRLGDACRCQVDGLLGADFFRNRIVQIDFANQRVRVLQDVPADDAAEVLPLDVRQRSFCVPIRVDDHGLAMVRLDTGCATPLHWVTDVAPSNAGSRIAVALAKLTTPTITAKVRMGSIQFEQQEVSLHTKPIFEGEAGLLGNGLLSNFPAITIDTRGRQLLLHHVSLR